MKIVHSDRLGNPFGYSTDPRFLFLDGVRRNVLLEVISAIATGAKALLVAGAAEIGKTAFLASLAVALGKCRDVQVLCVDGVFSCRPHTSLADIVAACQDPTVTRGNMAIVPEAAALGDRDNATSAIGVSARVLILDDADVLSDEVLADLWSWSTEMRCAKGGVTLVLSAGPSSGNGDNRRGIDLASVVDRAYSLQPFVRPQVEAFLRHCQRASGNTGPDLFTAAAVERIAFYSRGYPGRIARLCAHVLALTPPTARPIEGIHVKKAAWDLFLPDTVKDRLRELHLVPFLAGPDAPPPETRCSPRLPPGLPRAGVVPADGGASVCPPGAIDPAPPICRRVDALPETVEPKKEPFSGLRQRCFGGYRQLRSQAAAVGLRLRSVAAAAAAGARAAGVTVVAGTRISAIAAAAASARVAAGLVGRPHRAKLLAAAAVVLFLSGGAFALIDRESERSSQSVAGSGNGSTDPAATADPAVLRPDRVDQLASAAAADSAETASPKTGPAATAASDDLDPHAAIAPPADAQPLGALFESGGKDRTPVPPDANRGEQAARAVVAATTTGAAKSAVRSPAQPPELPAVQRRPSDQTSAAATLPPQPRPTGEAGGQPVRIAQTLLARLDYAPGPADGIVGQRTRAAVLRFQREHGLPANGTISEPLIVKLRAEVLARANAQRVPKRGSPSGIEAGPGILAKLFVFRLDSVNDPAGFRNYCSDNLDTWIFDKGSKRMVFCRQVAAGKDG
jgi:type II secretory pathway predicted ATPase ExeA